MKKHTVDEDVLILAIESSCDETAAAVVKNGRQVLSNIISSQIDLHTLYGGVVPEIASRKHIERINQVIESALKEAGVCLLYTSSVEETTKYSIPYYVAIGLTLVVCIFIPQAVLFLPNFVYGGAGI